MTTSGSARHRSLFHSEEVPKEAETTRAAGAPLDLTPTEREVLVELARPLASGHASAEPASDRDIADALGLDEAEVANHVEHLVEKFAILIGPAQRTRLADAAVKRGAIGATDLSDRPKRAR